VILFRQYNAGGSVTERLVGLIIILRELL